MSLDEDKLINRFLDADAEMMAPLIEQLRKIEARNAIIKAELTDLHERVKKLEKTLSRHF